MANISPKLEWCVARLGEDLNWWVEEISDDVHWDVDGLSIVDPRQIGHLLDQLDPLRDYDLQTDIVEAAFFRFKIDKQLGDDKVRLVRTNESFLESDEMLFALPDIIDEDKGPYADFLDHVAALRIKLLNDSIKFEKKLTVDELEDEIREEQNQDFMEGRAIHVFNEVSAIMDYIPGGYQLESDDEEEEETPRTKASGNEIEQEFPDIDDNEKIEEDETMKWDDDEEEEEEKEDKPYNPDEDGTPPTEDLSSLSDEDPTKKK